MSDRQLDFREERQNLESHLKEVRHHRFPISLLLDGLTDMRNVGALFRLADAARLHRIYGYGLPDLAGNKKLKRVARKTQKYVPYEPLKGIGEIEELKETNTIIGLEITTESLPYHQLELPDRPVLLAIGNEQRGLSPAVLELCDKCIHIPMLGVNTSMNVSVATGIAVYHMLDKKGFI